MAIGLHLAGRACLDEIQPARIARVVTTRQNADVRRYIPPNFNTDEYYMRKRTTSSAKSPLSDSDVEWLIKAIDLDCARLATAVLAKSNSHVVLTREDRDRFGLVGGIFYYEMRTLERHGLLRVRQITKRPPHNYRLERPRDDRDEFEATVEYHERLLEQNEGS
jgi:hypothetical protein